MIVKARWFIFGVLAALIVSGTALMASPVMRELAFGVNVTLDGELITFDDDMQPFIMDGRTFLPVRAIAEIMGLDVSFDGATNTVTLKSAISDIGSYPDLSSIPVSRGEWDGNVYTNDSLGFSFTLPMGWMMLDDAAISEIIGEVASFNEFAGWQAQRFTDMIAANPFTGANVQIVFENLQLPSAYVGLDEMEARLPGFEGFTIDKDIPGYTRIGLFDWYTVTTQTDMGNWTTFGRQYVTVQDDFSVAIVITYREGGITPADILTYFN